MTLDDLDAALFADPYAQVLVAPEMSWRSLLDKPDIIPYLKPHASGGVAYRGVKIVVAPNATPDLAPSR